MQPEKKSETFHPMSHYLRKKGISVEADVINLDGSMLVNFVNKDFLCSLFVRLNPSMALEKLVQ